MDGVGEVPLQALNNGNKSGMPAVEIAELDANPEGTQPVRSTKWVAIRGMKGSRVLVKYRHS